MFTVWEPILSTDMAPPITSVLGRMADTRVQQYWDADHVLAKQMERDARAPQPEQACCVREGVLWDLAAVYPKGVMWTDRMPPATLFNGPVVDIASELEAALTPQQ